MSIVDNRKAFHDYFIEERYEAGIALEGWEVKAIRAGRAQIGDGYVMVRGADLEKVAGALDGVMNANAQLTTFHQTRRPSLTKGEAART